MAYCIKLEVDISMGSIFGLNKIGLRGHTIWHEPHKVSEISHENKLRAPWKKIKNFFARLTGMTILIFEESNFFGSGHFLILEILKNGPKNDRSQKSYFNENQIFHARQPLEEIFEFFSCCGFIFMTDFWTFTRLFLNFVTSEAVLI